MEIIKSANDLFRSHIVVYDGEQYLLCEALAIGEFPLSDDMLFYDDGKYYRAVTIADFNPFELAEAV